MIEVYLGGKIGSDEPTTVTGAAILILSDNSEAMLDSLLESYEMSGFLSVVSETCDECGSTLARISSMLLGRIDPGFVAGILVALLGATTA